jgi:hypothetical protein
MRTGVGQNSERLKLAELMRLYKLSLKETMGFLKKFPGSASCPTPYYKFLISFEARQVRPDFYTELSQRVEFKILSAQVEILFEFLIVMLISTCFILFDEK